MVSIGSLLLSVGLPPATAQNAQSFTTYVRAASSEAQIEIDASKRSHSPIPRTIFGTFLEDIGQSVFGGVSAELLDNPSLEDYHASLTTLRERFSAPDFARSTERGLPLPWLPLHWGDGWRYEPRWGQAANSECYLYLMGLKDREVGIRQSVYLPIERERDYQGVLFALSTEGPVDLQVSFRKHDMPDKILAQSRVNVPGTGHWTKLPFRLSLPERAVAALEAVDLAVSVPDDHRLAVDEIRLYPSDAVDGLLDPDMIKAAKALHTPLLRYGGNFTSGYHWEDGIGPIDERRTMLNQSWGYPEYNEFGTDELMTFCRLIGARPQICLNLGGGTPAEARAWVEYCQGGPQTAQGKRRAANGHPEPYPVAAWELGNELWGKFQIGWQTPEGYAERYKTFYQAIRDIVPADTMVFANGADLDTFRQWNGALIAKDGADLSYLTTHFVVGMEDLKDKNQKPDQNALWGADFAIPVGVGRALEPMREQINASPLTRDRAKLAFTEWLFWASEHRELPRWDNLGGAIDAAGWLNMLLQHAEFVPVSDMTGLIEFGGIYKKRGRVYLTPQCWAFSLYSNYAGDVLLSTRVTSDEYDVGPVLRRLPAIPNVPYLDVVATMDSARGDVTLFVVNRNWKAAQKAAIRISGFQPPTRATVRTLSTQSILDENNEEHPDAVQPVTSTVEISCDTIHYTFPEHSLTVVTLSGR
jgi:alpha-L-arabinofuranosidase